MQLLNQKSILVSHGDEIMAHKQENEKILNQIRQMPDYKCAVICRSLDILSADQKPVVETTSLHFVDYIPNWSDASGGIDIYLDEKSFLVLIVYGSTYEYQGEQQIMTRSYRLVPYDENHVLLNIANALFYGGRIIPADHQILSVE